MSDDRVASMIIGGAKLGRVKRALASFVAPGVRFEAIEAKAQELIQAEGAVPSFSTVPGYHWATCLMRNDALCHGIPKNEVIEPGDIVTIDVGLIENGYHLDTTTTVAVAPVSPQNQHFLEIGQQALNKAIAKAKPGQTVYEISRAMQKTVESHGFGAVYQLTGHGIGKKLHDWPSIPCVAQRSDKKIVLKTGMTVAIEIMYTMGDPYLEVDKDGWTYRTADGSISGMFEETVLITENGHQILT